MLSFVAMFRWGLHWFEPLDRFSFVRSDVKFVARMDADDFSMYTASLPKCFLLNPGVAVVGSWCVESRDMRKPNFHKELPCDFDRLRKLH